MGLLDDAIREHLELKRRRGADADEVARQENEALGPPMRGEFAQPDDGDPAPEAAEDELAAERPAAVAASALEPDEEPWLEDEPEPQSTVEFVPPEVEDEDPGEAPEGREDVLEETPEFLQETPEHERLWFEQRPPRGFDFDK
jgi:hypothetical protein